MGYGMKNEDGIVVWDENVILSNHGDMKKADVDRLCQGISGHGHSIHRSFGMEESSMIYTYLFDTLIVLGIISDILDWEVRLGLHENKFTYTGPSTCVSMNYNSGIKKWGDK